MYIAVPIGSSRKLLLRVISLFIIAAICLEILRSVFLGQDMYKLALEKGEKPLKWVLGTILLWWGIEITVVLVWVYVLKYKLLIVGIIAGIAVARVVYYFFKKTLEEKPESDLEDKINQIGQEPEEEEEKEHY